MRTVLKRLLLIQFLFVGISSFAQYDIAYKTDYPKRFCILDSVFNAVITGKDPDEKKQALQEFKNIASGHGDEKALLLYEIIAFSILKDQQPFTEEAALALCNKVIKASRKLSFRSLEALIYLNLGNFYSDNLKRLGLGMYYYLRSYNIYLGLSNDEYHLKQISLQMLANLYYSFEDYEHSLLFAREALSFRAKEHDEVFMFNLAGMSCYRLKKYDSALFFFDETLKRGMELTRRNRLLGWQGIAEGNKGYCFMAMDKTDSARYYLTRAIDTTYKYGLYDNTCGFAIALSNIYLTQNSTAIEKLLPTAVYTTNAQGSIKDKVNLFALLKNYHQRKGSAAQALKFSDSLMFYKNLFFEKDGRVLLTQTELKYETDTRIERELNLEKEITLQKIYKTGFLIAVILLTLIALLLFNRQRLKHTLVQNANRARQLKAEQELEMARQRLHEFTATLSEKNKTIELIREQLKETSAQDYIVKLQSNTILTEEEWLNFKQLFEKVYPGFLNNMKIKIQGLTQAELRILALAKLNLNKKEMAAILGVSTQAVRTTWYRLRNRLSLLADCTLESFLQTIS